MMKKIPACIIVMLFTLQVVIHAENPLIISFPAHGKDSLAAKKPSTRIIRFMSAKFPIGSNWMCDQRERLASGRTRIQFLHGFALRHRPLCSKVRGEDVV